MEGKIAMLILPEQGFDDSGCPHALEQLVPCSSATCQFADIRPDAA